MFTTLLRDLKSLAVSNIEYYADGNHSLHIRFHQAFCLLHEHIDSGIQPTVDKILPKLSYFDLSPDVKANGFRSLFKILEKCCIHILQLSRHIYTNKTSLFFRSSHYCNEIEAYVDTLGQLRACLEHGLRLMDFCKDGDLFVDDEKIDDDVAEEITLNLEKLSQECFYGRTLGFQFCESMKKPLISLAILMASFSECYQNKSRLSKLTTSILGGAKYLMNPEERAKRVSETTRNADVNFCKSFWSIADSEVLQHLHSFVLPQVQVEEVITLEPELFDLDLTDGSDTVTITPACAHTGYGPVNVRLLSSEVRVGQITRHKSGGTTSKTVLPPSPCLLVHCHGGGFVAQSSKSHEVYLKSWAKELNVPILSIDYSHAPEFPFPRALEECFYAYAWAIKNCKTLGSTGEVICIAGDSAGGNLMISVAMRAASYGIRMPDGILAVYTPTLVHYTPTPSRMLSLMDPLLPVGVLVRCMAAYAGIPNDFLEKRKMNANNENADTDEEFEIIQIGEGSEDQEKSSKGTSVDPQLDNSQSDLRDDQVEVTSLDLDTCEVTVKSDAIQQNQGSNEKADFENCDSGNSDSDTKQDTENENCDVEEKSGSKQDADRNSVQTLSDEWVCEGSAATPSDLDLNLEKMSVDQGQGRASQGSLLTDSDVPCDSDSADGYKTAPETPQDAVPPAETLRDHPPLRRLCQQKSASMMFPGNRKKLSNKSRSEDVSGYMTPTEKEIGVHERLGMTKKRYAPLYSTPSQQIVSPVRLFRSLRIVKNPYMSPMVAPDDMLLQLPPLYLVACHFDPLLDDSIMFAKRLRELGKTVDLQVLEDLPHGFLNFSLISPEAKRGLDICVEKMRKIFDRNTT